ncbi:MAG: ABC transporter permease [Nitrospiraceae bacterium]|nr:ABC transporter permease [Nitrospiraceae bacterium]
MLSAVLLIAYRHLFARPIRTALTIVGISLGVSVSVAIQAANVDVLKSFEEAVITVAGRATLQVSGGELGVDERIIQKLRQHPHVDSATPVLQTSVRIGQGPHQGELLTVVGLDLLEAGDLKRFRVRVSEAGSTFEKMLSPNALFLGGQIASDLGVDVGSALQLQAAGREYQVIIQGIVESEAGLPTMWGRMGIMDIAAAQALFGLVGRLDRIDITTEPGSSIDRIAEEIKGVLPPGLTVARPSRRNEQVERMVRAFQLNLSMLSTVGLLVGLLLVYNTISFSVVQRRREIGMLCALGMGRQAISGVFVGEAAMMGIVGGIAGGWMGLLLARSILSLVSRTISDLYVPVEPTFGNFQNSVLSFLHAPVAAWTWGAAIGMVVSVMGAIGPSLDASRTAPARALAPGDYEAAQVLRAGSLVWSGLFLLLLAGLLALGSPIGGLPVFGYVSALCLLVGLSCLIPALIIRFGTLISAGSGSVQPLSRLETIKTLLRLAGDRIGRTPRRSAVTISAMMVGVAIMVGVGTMIGSFRHTVELWIEQTVLADLVVAPTAWLQGGDEGILAKRIPLKWADHVASIPGVEAVDTYRELTVELKGQPVALVSRNLRLHAERSRYWFLSGNSASILKETESNDGVVISEVLARTHSLGVGDSVPLMTPSGEHQFRVQGVFYDYATDGGKIVMDHAQYRRYWHDDTATVLAVYLAKGINGESIRHALTDRIRSLAPDSHPAVISNRQLKQEILAIFDRTFAVTYALELITVVIAILGIINTLVTSIFERQRELATLRSIGASARQVHLLMLCESAYLGLFGGIFGVIAGVLLSIVLIEVVNKQSFGWTVQFTLSAGLLVKAVALASAAALSAGYLPARWASNQRIADGLRYE